MILANAGETAEKACSIIDMISFIINCIIFIIIWNCNYSVAFKLFSLFNIVIPALVIVAVKHSFYSNLKEIDKHKEVKLHFKKIIAKFSCFVLDAFYVTIFLTLLLTVSFLNVHLSGVVYILFKIAIDVNFALCMFLGLTDKILFFFLNERNANYD